ncbi:MAG: ribosome small subunit-dependent GTPase A, partial [Pseudomonadota bacterium]|nr:ribosome small subunit-dependent GTPase A [Pseudomonadota bacterium]
TTLALGPSGAGKSTLVNLMVADAAAQVGEISAALNTGKHTTTATHWYWIDKARHSVLIDSPGFQEFGLRHIPANELAALMPDLACHLSACRFYNCTHVHEPGCGVLAALERGEIAETRYRIYREILAELQ